ncbi:DUF742 domain-containing protein [Saccharopolyspora sp. NPDC003752]|uniref:DUF742 domain-containing protein n=2 Tax=Saccharopolyspora TaxID=1835 RepID=A0A4V2YNT8_9PSEU|nr:MULTISPECIES: DUF742 domain-containing protein [Saccharopolyspora]TDD55667.1 DUF742 domain-containing protein [Saccharopolyspora elongata]SDW02839.1 Protein of unknown function [Saccharopolyspora shandongensis]
MDEAWYDDEAGPIVRPYTITRGRTPGKHTRLDTATQVITAEPRPEAPRLELAPEHRLILDACMRPVSLAELSVMLTQPLGVVRVLCGDLLDHGAVFVRSPRTEVSRDILEQVYRGLCRL